MDKKKILIVSQTIFPAQFPRSYRATELAKEFAKQGHEVILYATLGNYDYSNFEKENSLKVKNIGKMWFAKLNSVGAGKKMFFDKALGRIFNRLIEFPDIELMFRMPGILKIERKIDLLISVAMPHPIHWGCAMARSLNPNEFPQKWVADCGDPYMGNIFQKTKHLFYFKYLEKWFCKKANYITIPVKGAREGYYPEFHHKIKIVPQGFHFNSVDINNDRPKNSIPTFAYSGSFYKGFRDPSKFLEYLTTIQAPFKFIIYTRDQPLIEPYLSRLAAKIEVRPCVPRNELLKTLSTMDFLINIENGTSVQSPSKLIDYALTKRPILSFTSDAIPEANFLEFLQGDYTNQFIVQNIEQYRIENVAKSFLKLLAD
jgi:hypothetical protein